MRFSCQSSGKCCVLRGGFGYVYLTLEDRRRLARHLGLNTRSFTREYCRKDETGFYFLRDEEPGQKECRFLEGKQCGVYEARPTQCRTWPFWPENMSAKTWSRDVAGFCPGVGKGSVWSQEQIEAVIEEQEKADSGS